MYHFTIKNLSIASCTVQNSSVPSTAPLRKDQQIQMNTNEIQRESISLNDCRELLSKQTEILIYFVDDLQYSTTKLPRPAVILPVARSNQRSKAFQFQFRFLAPVKIQLQFQFQLHLQLSL